MQVVTAGFCVLGGASLLMLLLDSLLVSKPDNKSVQHSDDHDQYHRKSTNLDLEAQHQTRTRDAIVGVARPAVATQRGTGEEVPGVFVEAKGITPVAVGRGTTRHT